MDNEQRNRPVRRRRRQRQQLTYTEPKPFNRKKFLLQLLIVAAVVVAMVFIMSIFFKVGSEEDSVLVAGNDRYTTAQVIEAAGIREGDSVLFLNRAKIRARILQQLPYVRSVRVGIKLPNTVNIEITESQVLYSVEALDGNWWLINHEGKVLEQTNWVDAKDHTVITGVRIQIPETGLQAVAIDPEPVLDAEGNTLPPVLTGEQSLSTVLQIVQLLERFGVLGEAASVNIEDPVNIHVWYGERFRIDLGDHLNLEKKLGYAVSAMEQLEENRTGVIDVSFTINTQQPVFTAFAD